MHIKHQKTEEVESLVVADSEQFLCFSIFDFRVRGWVGVLTGCTGSGREAITAGPRFMGHHPKARWRQRF